MKKRPYISHDLEIRFCGDVIGNSSIKFQMDCIFELLRETASLDPLLRPAQWLIATGEKDSSYLYQAFDDNGPTTAALAVIGEANKENTALQRFSLWNGEEDHTKGASITCLFNRQDGRSSSLTFGMDSEPDGFRLENSANGVKLLVEAAQLYKPLYCSISPGQYDAVFPDRPGVGWMLYLPRLLTIQQVPEARALVPVMGKAEKGKEKQIGTIIVSITDAPFSDENPEHVKIANAIEIRLVDQDLLPRYADL
ncbi:immunity 52 family protein [Pseudoduganella sp. LjRoot289]|uniref:immunity 52 family protein n=1 Tax=Pseudoduganella sp. LjRoot289 TaxID=3342314 RepID=UPI003ED144B2